MSRSRRSWSALRVVFPGVVLLAGLPLGLSADHTPDPTSVTIVGSLQSELGCPGDWQPDCAATHLTYDAGDDVWQATFNTPAGNWEYKAALNDSWDENYGAGGVQNGNNISLDLGAETEVKFYYDHKSHWVTDNENSVIATVAGDFQSEIGCPGDWQPDCLRSWMQDPDGDGVYTFATDQIPAGDHEFKVALDEVWTVSYPASNVPFSSADGDTVTFTYDSATNDVTVDVVGGGPRIEPGDELLVRPPVRVPAQDEVFYFVLPDRFENGDPFNDAGGDLSGDPLVNGLEPSRTGYYHGGDLAGLTARLEYLDDLGVTAIWMTPQFTNRWVQGDGTLGGSSAGYHGYWQVDYTQIEPHFGTNAEMTAFVDAAHARGIKVFFDIVANHTADVITYAEETFSYRNKTDYPYRDAGGDVFDDRDYAGTGTFPELDAATSFPYTPAFFTPADETVKSPAWLNDPTLYHNRGNSTFTGENSLYGDFFGLDDLFTEHPDVQDGLIQVFKDMVTAFDVDGFRVDTVKHVNDEFWQAFGPEIEAHATALGKTEFFVFGEVFDGDPAFTSRYTTALPFPAVLDFAFQGAARNFAAEGGATDNVASFFATDDLYTDNDSNAYALPTFLGNHDLGRVGWFLNVDNPGAADAELLARDKLAHALMFFGRGMPVIYYGDEQGFTGDGGDKDACQDMMPSLVPSYNDDNLIGTDATTADDNFDATHPLYQTLADYAAVLEAHPTLTRSAQLHRYSQGSAGIYAFSRIEREEQVEHLVVLNNSESPATAVFGTDSPDTGFTEIYPGDGPGPTADASGAVTVGVEGLGVRVFRADAPVSSRAQGIEVTMASPSEGDEVLGRVEVGASLAEARFAEVTFAVSVDGGAFEPIGTDDNAPYRIFFDVSGLAPGASVVFKAIVDDRSGHLSSDKVAAVVGEEEPPPSGDFRYAIIHYNRPGGDYGDHTTGDSNDFWGLHLWGDAIDPSEVTDWTNPKPFLGEDEFGRFAWIARGGSDSQVNFIVHKGDTKDGTDADRFFNADAHPEIWIKADDATIHTSRADAQGFVMIHYHRDDGDYGDPTSPDYNDFWGLHLWGDAIDPSEGTEWTSPKAPTGADDFGVFWQILIVDPSQPVNFIIHRGDTKDPGPDESFVPAETPTVWKQSGDETVYPSRGAAENVAVIHYHRPAGDYGDFTSSDYNDFWGLHTWGGASDPGWTTPRKPATVDLFGPVYRVPLFDDAEQIGYILHRGDEKDPGPDQFLVFAEHGYEIWQMQGADPENPYILPIAGEPAGNPGNIDEQAAYWLTEDTLAWAAGETSGATFTLHYAPTGGLDATEGGITGGSFLTLIPDPAGLPPEVQAKFPHLAALPALKIDASDLALVPELLKGQIAVSAVSGDGRSVDATGLQVPGVLDDLYAYDGALGATWEAGAPTIRVWAPTARAVTLHLFPDSDPATTSTTQPMTPDPTTGVWSAAGESSWQGQYYLFEVEVYVHSTGQVEHNLVTDPYSISLAMNSARCHIVDLEDPALAPLGWDTLVKPPLPAPEDISIYEIHVRDFSVFDPSVPDELKGTYKAFTLEDTNGTNHLGALRAAGLTHLHLLPVFDIATINEKKADWQAPDPAVLAMYPPDSDQQQAAVTATEDLDGFNWGYDPFHYTTPEGSYSANPDGATRIVEFREMVQALNEDGLRVVMDVVYNHTNAAGQEEKSVLDRIVPGYYHRLNDRGQLETSTCCANTASEHDMMEKLMVDSLVTWAKQYKVDAFRFDLMGHHMVRNMESVRAALDGLTLAEDGIDGRSIYIYGEGWNFGEVADNARGVNATQLNLGGTGIGTFSDRLRDAVRGGGPFDSGQDLIRNQGFANGLWYDPNTLNTGSMSEKDALLLRSDQIRVGMAGNLATYQFVDRNGNLVTGADVDYNGQPTGYTLDPQEVIAYISKHDNQTLYDNNTYKAPVATTMADRVRIQNVGLSTVLLGQGVPFLHAGSDLLRSKSFDRDSFNSGDWFNKLDFTYQENNFGVGLPVAGKNADNWPIMQPLLANPGLKPAPDDIAQMAERLQELLQIRYSSKLFRLETAADVQARVAYHNTGPSQIPGLIVMSIADDTGAIDRATKRIVALFNANDEDATFGMPAAAGRDVRLHPVQLGSSDPIVGLSSFDATTGTFSVPGRTTAVFVDVRPASDQIELLIGDIEALVAAGVLNHGQGNALISKLENIQEKIARGQTNAAVNQLQAFINQVEAFVRSDKLTPAQGAALIAAAEDILAALMP